MRLFIVISLVILLALLWQSDIPSPPSHAANPVERASRLHLDGL